MQTLTSNVSGSEPTTGRSATWLAAAALALAVGFAAAPAHAGNEFANAFEHQLGRIVAHQVGAIGQVAFVEPVIHAIRYEHGYPVEYAPRYEPRYWRHDQPHAQHRPHYRPHRGHHFEGCGHHGAVSHRRHDDHGRDGYYASNRRSRH